MRVKIYQINPERDNNRMKFMSLSDSQSPDPSIYDEVFDAEIDENGDVITRHNHLFVLRRFSLLQLLGAGVLPQAPQRHPAPFAAGQQLPKGQPRYRAAGPFAIPRFTASNHKAPRRLYRRSRGLHGFFPKAAS